MHVYAFIMKDELKNVFDFTIFLLQLRYLAEKGNTRKKNRFFYRFFFLLL